MAEGGFAPSQPVEVGTPYIYWSREITQPQPNKAGEIIGKSIGKGIEEAGAGLRAGAEGVKAAVELGLENDVYKRGDAFMNQEINNLYKVYAGVEDTPGPVKNLPQDTAVLKDARANGKISNTDHDARLDVLAKELRAKYPGFRPEVDEHLRAATGRGSTANQLYESIRGDIDASVAMRKEGRNKVHTELWGAVNAGVPGASSWMQMYDAGKLSDLDVAKKLNGAYSYKYENAQTELQIHQLQAQKDQKEAVADTAEKNGVFRLHHIIHDEMDNYVIQFGSQTKTLQQWEDAINSGEFQPTPEQTVQLKQVLAARGQYIRDEYTRQMHQPNERGESLASAMGDEKFSKGLEAGMKSYESFSNFVVAGKFSMANAVSILTKAQRDAAMSGAQADPEIGETLKKLEIIRTMPQAAQSVLIGQVIGDSHLTDSLKAKLLQSTTGMATPADTTFKQGYKTTLAAELEKARKNQLPPSAIKTLMDSVALVGNTKIPDAVRLHLAESIYGFDDQGNVASVVDKFNTATNKNGTQDMNEVFKALTSGKSTRQLWKLGQEYPEIWDRYQTFVENQWQSKNMVDLLELDKFAQQPGFSIHYDTEHNEFKVELGGDKRDPRRLYGLAEREHAQIVTRRINDGLRNMQYLYENLDRDVTASYIKLLYKSGMQPKTITGKMIDAMENAYSSTSGDPRE